MIRFSSNGIVPTGLLLFGASVMPVPSRTLPPFVVSGTVLDTQGKPISGAIVRLNADFVYGRAQVTTGADGRYTIGDLIKATYRAQAHIERPYNGGTVCQQLAMPSPTDYNSFPVSQGAVRNFRWQLTGRVGLSSDYFGATITMWWIDYAARERARAVEFTLTPNGPLIDGSRAAVIVREVPLHNASAGDDVKDLPLGTYSLQAVLIGKDGRRSPLFIGTKEEGQVQAVVPLVWQPTRGCDFGGSAGVEPFFARIETSP